MVHVYFSLRIQYIEDEMAKRKPPPEEQSILSGYAKKDTLFIKVNSFYRGFLIKFVQLP